MMVLDLDVIAGPMLVEAKVTANAQLLLGYIAGSIAGEYQVVSVDADQGAVLEEHHETKNRYRITALQTEGVE